jgi:hypothetical protein
LGNQPLDSHLRSRQCCDFMFRKDSGFSPCVCGRNDSRPDLGHLHQRSDVDSEHFANSNTGLKLVFDRLPKLPEGHCVLRHVLASCAINGLEYVLDPAFFRCRVRVRNHLAPFSRNLPAQSSLKFQFKRNIGSFEHFDTTGFNGESRVGNIRTKRTSKREAPLTRRSKRNRQEQNESGCKCKPSPKSLIRNHLIRCTGFPAGQRLIPQHALHRPRRIESAFMNIEYGSKPLSKIWKSQL